jgi:hypothetical protein
MATQWPPQSDAYLNARDWAQHIQRIGKRWRTSIGSEEQIPSEVGKWWATIIERENASFDVLLAPDGKEVCDALIQICAAADEASEGVGLANSSGDSFDKHVDKLLGDQLGGDGWRSTLSQIVDPARVCVLPKLHTPQSGMTIRSISHHLSLCMSDEVRPQLVTSPTTLNIEDTLNLLLVPWPTVVSPHFFSPCGGQPGLRNLPSQYGFFRYHIRGGSEWPSESFERILKAAQSLVERIDGIIFPELSLRTEDAEVAWRQVQKVFPNCFIVGGVGSSGTDNSFGINQAVCMLPQSGEKAAKFTQDKHHRWMLNRSQIQQYGLFRRLAPDRMWWENISLPPRIIKFVQLSPWLTFSFLICEDLARQDPVADLIRAVGPNLVIAILMDGPQLAHRWSARYAMVLTDDPGCSVLTLTSLGMARLSTCLGKPESRVIALWKDVEAGPHEINLPYDSEAMILQLSQKITTEWSADGRSDDNAAGHWILDGTTPVRLGN